MPAGEFKPGQFIRLMRRKAGFESFLASAAAIGIGLIFGLILLVIFKADKSLYGFSQILLTGFGSSAKFAKVLYQAAPLIMTVKSARGLRMRAPEPS